MIDNLAALAARDDLLAVAASWESLRARLTPSGSKGSETKRPTPASRLPIDVAVSDLMRQVEEKARFYARVLCDDDPEFAPPSVMPGTLEAVAHRYGHFTHRLGDRMALDFLDDAHEMRRMVAGILAQHAPRRWLGPCLTEECPGELHARDGHLEATCRECGATWGPMEWRAHLEVALEGRLMTLSEVASALVALDHKVPYSTVRRWASSGQMPKIVTDPNLYRIKDALGLANRRSAPHGTMKTAS